MLMQNTSDKLIELLKKIFKKYKWDPQIEIEIRFGWFDKITKRFNSDISKDFYEKVLKHLDSSSRFKKTCQNTKEFITKNGQRVVYDTADKNEKLLNRYNKNRIEVFDIYVDYCPFDIRVSISKEQPTKYIDSKWTHVRYKERESYQYKMWSYDITKVYVPTEYIRDSYVETNESFEFEIEFKNDYINCLDNNYLANSIFMKINDILNIDIGEPINHLKNYTII